MVDQAAVGQWIHAIVTDTNDVAVLTNDVNIDVQTLESLADTFFMQTAIKVGAACLVVRACVSDCS